MPFSLSIAELLSAWDWIAFFAVLLLTFAVVLWGHTAQASSSLVQYILMGRQLTLPLFVATLVATWYGGIFGVTQIAFDSGIYNFLIQGLFWYAAYFLFAFFVLRRIDTTSVMTLPELLGRTIGPKAGVVAGLFNLANVLPVSYVISLGLLVNTLFGIPFVPAMILGTAFVLAYSSLSGFRAVVFSDLVQFGVMVSAVALVLVLSVSTFGGWSFLKANLPETHFRLWGGVPLGSTLVWGFIALSTLVDPSFYQRCFAAQSKTVARKGILISIGIWVGFDICTTGGALYARAVLPDAPSNQAYLLYGLQLLPEGLRGFFLAGIAATILSTLDSRLFLGSNTLAYDLFPRWFGSRIFRHRLGIAAVATVAIVLGSAFEGNIRAVWRTLGSYSAACLLFPVLITYLLPGRLSDRQFTAATLSGAAAITWHRLVHPLMPLDSFYVGLIVTGGVLLLVQGLRLLWRRLV